MQLSPVVVTREKTLGERHQLQEVVQLDLVEVDQRLIDCFTPGSTAAGVVVTRDIQERTALYLQTSTVRTEAKYLVTMLVHMKSP